jgi:uncharacterized protein
MPTRDEPVVEAVRVADRRHGRFLLVNAETGAWGVTNRAGMRRLSDPRPPSALADLRQTLLAQAPGGPVQGDLGETGPLYVIYKLTDTCNFRCVYCYDRAFARRKDTSRRDAAIREVLDAALAGRTGRVHVLFHGGEPLEELPELRALVERYETYGADRIQFSVQTNGSLLDADTVDFFRAHGVGLSVSVDGADPAANRLRVVGGRPDPYDLLKQRIEEIPGLDADRLGLLLTVGRHNVAGLVGELVHMQRDGFRSASLSFMQEVGPGARAAAPDELVGALQQVVAAVVRGELSDLAVWTLVEWVRQLVERRAELTCMTSPCGAGRTVVTVLPSGEVGPCDSIFDPRYYAPDLASYERERADADSRLGQLVRRGRHAHEPCRSCDVGAHCNGTCPGNAILQGGDPAVPAGEECAFHYAWILELMWLLSDDRQAGPLLSYCARHVRQREATRAQEEARSR